MDMNVTSERLTLRKLLQYALDSENSDSITLDTPIYIVPEDAVKDEYVDDSPSPERVYAPNSWVEAKRIYVDDESSFENILIIVTEPRDDKDIESDDAE